jgi:formate--tetrahydrofolate ligase
MGREDYEIAQQIKLKPISDVAKQALLFEDDLYKVGPYMAKVMPTAEKRLATKPTGKLILVSAMTPTPAGEGKSTTTIGLAMALCRMGRSAVAALREPSLGPCFGKKGGAAGGGWSQVLPMEDINLHFTGDLHATAAAHNLLAAIIDNHLFHGNRLGIDPRSVTWRRVLDMNDRSLRNIVAGLGGHADGIPRETGFDVTVASEVMASLCLANNLEDLRTRLGRIIVAYRFDGSAVHASELKAHGAMAALLKHAVYPNLVQTTEGTPALIHGGPFANIAHGCSSVIATKLAMQMADYCVTEAGFGFDLGGEKFLNIKCRSAGLSPHCVVLVATVRALKYHGGGEDLEAMTKGFANLQRHIENVKLFGLPAIVAINRFSADQPEELEHALSLCRHHGIPSVISDVWAKGGAGGEALAGEVVRIASTDTSGFKPLYAPELSIEDKIKTVVTSIYRGADVSFMPAARKILQKVRDLDLSHLPVCMAKTQYSFSDNSKLIGAPERFSVEVRDARISAGAGFIVALTGQIMTMPGLPASPAAEGIDVEADGTITGLF